MIDILLELVRAIVLLIIVILLQRKSDDAEISHVNGWNCLFFGFILVLGGSLFDISDNFPQLDRFVIVGDTPVQAFFEKIVGYLGGFILIAIGISKWLPQISEHQEKLKKKLIKVEKEYEELSGILPICSYCNQIRDDEGYWNKLESFIQSRSEAKFSHSICPKCLKGVMKEIEDGQQQAMN